MFPEFGLIVLALIAILLFSAINILKPNQRGVMFTLGRFSSVKGPGLIIVIPGIQKMVRVDLRVIVMDVLDEQGQRDPLRLPLYDVILDDADATFALLVGYLRLLGAAYAQQIAFISDGADWIWDRVNRLVSEAEIPQERLVLV